MKTYKVLYSTLKGNRIGRVKLNCPDHVVMFYAMRALRSLGVNVTEIIEVIPC